MVRDFRRRSLSVIFNLLFALSSVKSFALIPEIRMACESYLRVFWPKPTAFELQRRMLDRANEFRRLSKGADYVTGIFENLSQDGNNNNGVYRLSTQDGAAVIKILPLYHDHSDSLIEQIILQNFLADLGYAPRVYAVLGKDQLREILFPEECRRIFAEYPCPRSVSEEFYNALTGTQGYELGIVMEEIPEAWNILRSTRVPSSWRQWDLRIIEARLKEIERTLKLLNILPLDAQPAVSATGEVFLIDVAHYYWNTPDGFEYGKQNSMATAVNSLFWNRIFLPWFSWGEVIEKLKKRLREFASH